MAIAIYEFDLFSEAGITEPYPHYAAIRDMGPVVRLSASDVLAVGRYADVKQCLFNHKQFVSGHGIALNSAANDAGKGTTLMSDPPLHQTLRALVGAPLTPQAVAEMRHQIQQAANELIDRLAALETFDAMRDLAMFLPVSIVSNLVGLPEDGRENMLAWAAATFDAIGPPNERLRSALPLIGQMVAYLLNEAGPSRVKPGSWAARIYQAAEKGLVTKEQVPFLLIDYLGPSLDTTIFATGHLIRLMGEHPRQWQTLRSNPALIPNAINETVRLESPIRGFSRVTVSDCEIGGEHVRAGSRLLMLYASANRDDRKWQSPETFDIQRTSVQEQLGFGFGRHVCAGQHLARLEIECLLRAMTRRFTGISTGTPVIQFNNTLRGYSSLPVRVH